MTEPGLVRIVATHPRVHDRELRRRGLVRALEALGLTVQRVEVTPAPAPGTHVGDPLGDPPTTTDLCDGMGI